MRHCRFHAIIGSRRLKEAVGDPDGANLLAFPARVAPEDRARLMQPWAAFSVGLAPAEVRRRPHLSRSGRNRDNVRPIDVKRAIG